MKKCKLCENQTYESQEVCVMHMNVEYGAEEEVARLKTLAEVVDLLEKLQREFPLTNFKPFSSIIESACASYSYEAELRLQEEGNCDCISSLELFIKTHTFNGFTGNFYFLWNTSGNHTVRIEGNIFPSGEEKFFVFIGTDESEFFYPKIKELVK